MPHEYLEHANITVRDLDGAVRFLAAALPSWRIRGQGEMSWYGKTIRWLHFGTDHNYVALQDGGEGNALAWNEHHVGTKHIGIVVPSVDAVVGRLKHAGYELDHWGGEHPHRRNVYVIERDHLQFEFVEYHSDSVAERNDYSFKG